MNRRRIAVFFLLLFSITYLNAVNFKFFGGLNLSSYKFNSEIVDSTSDSVISPVFGIGADFKLSKNLYLGIDTIYQSRSGSEYVFISDLILGIKEISFPLYIKYKFKETNSLYLFGGGEFSYILSYNAELKNTGIKIGLKTEDKDFELGLLTGLGYEFNVGKFDIFIESRFYLGFVNAITVRNYIYSGFYDYNDMNKKILFRTFYLSLGIKI